MICSCRKKFYPVRVDPFVEGSVTLGSKQEVTEHVCLRIAGPRSAIGRAPDS